MKEESKDVKATPTSEDKDAKLVTGVAHGDPGDENDHRRRKEDDRRDD